MTDAGVRTSPRELVRRSMIVVPATDEAGIETAVTSGADAICLDLEDTVPVAQKPEARRRLRDAIERCAPHADVLVRINGAWEEAARDLEACVWPGLDGVRLPKAEEPAEAQRVDARVGELEQERGLPAGGVGISLIFESVRGIFASLQLAGASPRLTSVSLGHEDYARDLGVEPTAHGAEALLPQLWLVLLARQAGLHPIGSLGRPQTEDDVRAAASWLRSVGFRGAATTSSEVVRILNEEFTPTREDVDRARRVIDAFEGAERSGTGILTVEGIGMIDLPVVERARRVVAEAARLGLDA